VSLNETYQRYFTLEEAESGREDRLEFAKDCGRFIATDSYKRLRAGLDALVASARWEPGMSAETASHMLIEQTAYRKIAAYLDQLVVIAKEKLDGAKG
jgi:hypothetical protein